MKFRINWRAGLLSGLAVAIVGIVLFVIVGSSVDYACKNTASGTAGCRVYLTANRAVSGYSDIWRSLFARRCLGGQGPDDCLGPDALIMAGTLFAIGFVGGSLIRRKKLTLSIKIERSKFL